MTVVDARLTRSLGLRGSEVRVDADGVPRVWYLPLVDLGPLSSIALRIEDDAVVLAPEVTAIHAGDILAVAARIAGFSCCHLRAEIEVLVDGRRWEGTCPDHLWHIENWFPALLEVLKGDHAVAGTFIWDQSGLGLTRDGDRLTLTDPMAPIVEVDAGAFGRAMLREGRLLAHVAESLRQEVLVRGGSAEALEALVPFGAPDKPTSPVPGDVARVCAIIWHELRFLEELPATLDAMEAALTAIP